MIALKQTRTITLIVGVIIGNLLQPTNRIQYILTAIPLKGRDQRTLEGLVVHRLILLEHLKERGRGHIVSNRVPHLNLWNRIGHLVVVVFPTDSYEILTYQSGIRIRNRCFMYIHDY